MIAAPSCATLLAYVASLQACGHKACDSLATSCTGMSPLPPDAKDCPKSAVAQVAAGACSADDAKKASTVAFSCQGIKCAKAAFFNPAKTATCIASDSGISSGCATCFGQVRRVAA